VTSPGKTNHKSRVRLPDFDPKPSAEFGAEVLREAGLRFALIGRIAIWTHLPEGVGGFTKDVDFAIPLHGVESLRAVLTRRGYTPLPLTIGGLAVRQGDIRVDFIDRREGGLDGLYLEAIEESLRTGHVAEVGSEGIPVVTAEYLVAMKVVAGEDRDEADAVLLLSALTDLDLSRTRSIIAQHGGAGSANRLDALARRAGRADARAEYRNGG
jgi:hypothetical protein